MVVECWSELCSSGSTPALANVQEAPIYRPDYVARIKYAFRYFLRRYGLRKTARGIFFYHYDVIRRLFLGSIKEQLLEINGCKLLVVPEDKGISAELLLYRTHEPLATELLSSELREGMVCLDIGSNIGYYACLESKIVGEAGKVIAIEPSAEAFRYLERNARLQGTSNLEIYSFACGASDGYARFAVSNRSNWSRVLDQEETQSAHQDSIRVIEVPVRSIDSFLDERELERLDFVRMDVEGYELHVCQGMRRALRRFRPVLQIEVHNFILKSTGTVELLLELSSAGYEGKVCIPRELDMPFIGSMLDAQTTSLDRLIEQATEDWLPPVFQLFLQPADCCRD